MEPDHRERLRSLLAVQRVLLADVAARIRTPDLAEADYRRNHQALRPILVSSDVGHCVCPWGTVFAWWGYAQSTEDWEVELEKLFAPFAHLVEDDDLRWRIEPYWRNGDENDQPFRDEFVAHLSEEAQVVLDQSLQRELAVRGLELLGHGSKGETCHCRGGGNVFEYKIEEGAPSGRVVLRVFFDTAPDQTLVLLHGYVKGAGDSKRRQSREIGVACGRRQDLLAQIAAAASQPSRT